MVLTLDTNLPMFTAEYWDVLRLFYPGAREDAASGAPVSHTHEHADGEYVETWRMGGFEHVFRAPDAVGAVAEKRMIKRASKTGLYELLRQVTGIHPPWGSLTGIRPTRLMYEALSAGMDLAQAERYMVERFDVDGVRAKLLRDILMMQRGVIEHDQDAFDVYVGIPFCTTRCAYCSFSSGTIGDGKLTQPYVDALVREMELSSALIRDMKPRAFYMGGGTPTSLSAAQLDRILNKARELFPGAAEWTVEAGRPDTIDEAKLRTLSENGVTRISVNPQTFSDVTLARIGRAHAADDTVRAYEQARRMGFNHINMDLIAALPEEDERDFADSLERAISLDPESITVHTLAIKHGSKLNELGYRQADAEQAQRMVDIARERLELAGYSPYYLYRQKYMAGNLENVGYAKPGYACAYNIDIMEETTPILALGAGAITKWLFDRQLRIERAPNVKNIEQYIERVDEMVRRKAQIIPSGGSRV